MYKQDFTQPSCLAVYSYACMEKFINMNSICLLEAVKTKQSYI